MVLGGHGGQTATVHRILAPIAAPQLSTTQEPAIGEMFLEGKPTQSSESLEGVQGSSKTPAIM